MATTAGKVYLRVETGASIIAASALVLFCAYALADSSRLDQYKGCDSQNANKIYWFALAFLGFALGVIQLLRPFMWQWYRTSFGFMRARLGRFFVAFYLGLVITLTGTVSDEPLMIILGVAQLVTGTLHLVGMLPCIELSRHGSEAMKLEEEGHPLPNA